MISESVVIGISRSSAACRIRIITTVTAGKVLIPVPIRAGAFVHSTSQTRMVGKTTAYFAQEVSPAAINAYSRKRQSRRPTEYLGRENASTLGSCTGESFFAACLDRNSHGCCLL